MCRFDIKGLDPESEEDEGGIRKAGENCKYNHSGSSVEYTTQWDSLEYVGLQTSLESIAVTEYVKIQ